MVSVMSAATAEVARKSTEEAMREVQPATKADIDRLFNEIRRLQDDVRCLQHGNAFPEGLGGITAGGDIS